MAEEKVTTISPEKRERYAKTQAEAEVMAASVNEFKKTFLSAGENPANLILSEVNKHYKATDEQKKALRTVLDGFERKVSKAGKPKGFDSAFKSLVMRAVEFELLKDEDFEKREYQLTADGSAIAMDEKGNPIFKVVKADDKTILAKIEDKIKNKKISVRQNCVKHLTDAEAIAFKESVAKIVSTL